MGQQQYSGQFPLVAALSSALNAGAGADDASIGTVAWNNPNNIAVAGQSASTASVSGTTHYLDATNFGFDIPTGATINGVVATILKATNNSATFDNSVKLVRAGAPSGADHLSAVKWQQGGLTPTTYGDPDDLWGLALTASDVNAANFGVALSAKNSLPATASVGAFVQLQIYYTTTGGGPGIAIADSLVSAASSQWTAGATAILPVPFQPGLTTPWSITGWSLSYQGQLLQPAGAAVPSLGRLGELWCGLLFNTGGSTQGRTPPWVTPARPLPQDLSTFAKVWDGSTDPPFPWQSATAPPKYNGFSSELPIPQKMQSGEQVAIGLWLQPALVQNVQTLILNASYTIVYDDGLTAAPASITSGLAAVGR
jgi:hypothetical protein